MKYLLFVSLLVFSLNTYAQKKSIANIIISVRDTTALHEKVTTALVRGDFAVKDLPGDTITTYARELRSMVGYALAVAVIDGNTVTLSGYYTTKRRNFLGYERLGEYRRITKFRGSKLWPLMEKVASFIGDDLTYSR